MALSAQTIWIIAGEESGDGYGAQVAKELQRLQPGCQIKGMGGEKMRQAGVDLMVDATELGIVGLVEVLKKLFFFIGLLRRLTRQARLERPDSVLLIDYPGFNLRFASRLHTLGIPVVYYISPQVWAWKKQRIHLIARTVSRLLCIFPFEPAVYDGTGLETHFVGHPLLETLLPLLATAPARDPNLILLLPGSRSGELHRHLPIFAATAAKLQAQNPDYQFVMPLPRQSCADLAQKQLAGMPAGTVPKISITVGDARQWMLRASAGLAASGTVTVESSILELPLVVTYKVNWLTGKLARRIIKLPFISIANLINGREVFTELLQEDATADKLAPAIIDIMPGGKRRKEVLAGINECVSKLGGGSQVSTAVAQHLLETAKKPPA